MTVRKELDQLIDWYEANAPDTGRVIQIAATANTVKKFARKGRKRGGPFIYRNREIVPMRKPRKLIEPAQQSEAQV